MTSAFQTVRKYRNPIFPVLHVLLKPHTCFWAFPVTVLEQQGCCIRNMKTSNLLGVNSTLTGCISHCRDLKAERSVWCCSRLMTLDWGSACCKSLYLKSDQRCTTCGQFLTVMSFQTSLNLLLLWTQKMFLTMSQCFC